MISNVEFENLFKNYNLQIQKTCEEALMYVKTHRQYEELINKARNEWEKKLFNGKLPTEYFNEINEKKQLKDIFISASDICDEFIPISFLNAIIRLGEIKVIEEFAFLENEISIRVIAIKTLGKIKSESSIQKLIDSIYIDTEELIKEVSRQALIDLGNIAIPYMLEHLNKKKVLYEDDFHLVIAIIEIDKETQNSNIYISFKEYFKKAEDKKIMVRCFADYGNPKAIAFLRGYLSRKKTSIDENLIFELVGAIEKLGGSADNI